MLTAGPILATGEPPINFRAHEVRTGNSAGARDDFEQMLAMLVRATHPGARLIAANPGDWAIDVLVGDLAGAVVIWQAKYFMPLVTESHQAQIRESFTSALKAAKEHGHHVRQWVLCVPSSMDAPTDKWWTGWKQRKQRETGVRIELWNEVELRRRLISPDSADVRRTYYDPYHSAAPAAVVAGPPVLPVTADAAASLDTTLFVRQLREAGHRQVTSAKLQFFNAELLAREIVDKDVPSEIAALVEADATVHGIWEAGFNEVSERHPTGSTLPGLHAAVMKEVRDMDVSWPSSLRATPVHKCGMVHRIVEDSRAGWVPHWEDIAVDHRGKSPAAPIPLPRAADAAQPSGNRP
ncbi:serine/threonine protein kinase [Micromonospora endolithica]|uniref:serine/threonine protein kinase n=1 Tax=Micromonospora endolithica TaxID=230091 RepID=UPI0011AC48F3|nr:serine/threonine protein kinase [Micromonospora endolithica]TWJ24226.1 hypothetical protein JD76_04374 [Micromonospora endolithica]